MQEEEESHTAGGDSSHSEPEQTRKNIQSARDHMPDIPCVQFPHQLRRERACQTKKRPEQLDHKRGWGKSFLSNKGRLSHKSLGGEG